MPVVTWLSVGAVRLVGIYNLGDILVILGTFTEWIAIVFITVPVMVFPE